MEDPQRITRPAQLTIAEKAIMIAGPVSPQLRWERRFPGTPEQPAAARHWIQALLPTGPAQEDLLTIAGELTANAIRHTRSQAPGGTFGVTVCWHPGFTRLVVSDQGSPTAPVLVTHSDGTGGLGLFVVSKLASQWGVTGGEDGHNVWADVCGLITPIRSRHPGSRPGSFLDQQRPSAEA